MKTDQYRTITYQPTNGKWAVDVYDSEGNRLHCGQGHLTIRRAMNEATEFLTKHTS